MNEEEYEEYYRLRELEEDWTIEVDENNKLFLDMWMAVRVIQILTKKSRMAKPSLWNDSFNQKIEKKSETAKYYSQCQWPKAVDERI